MTQIRNQKADVVDGGGGNPSQKDVAPGAVHDGDQGEPPRDVLNFVKALDRSTWAILISILIVVGLMIFSE